VAYLRLGTPSSCQLLRGRIKSVEFHWKAVAPPIGGGTTQVQASAVACPLLVGRAAFRLAVCASSRTFLLHGRLLGAALRAVAPAA
jgi:hypothetical protein